MTFVDVIVLVLLSAAVWLGIKQGLIKQLCVAVAVLGGLSVAAFVYGKLAFLSEGSGTRTVILLILTLAILFLCYSVAFTVALWILHKWHHPRNGHWHWAGAVAGGGVALCSAALALWIITAMFGPVSPTAVRRQVANARILHAIQQLAETPWLFRKVAYAMQPFNAPTAFVAAEPNFNSSDTVVDQTYRDLDSAATHAQHAVVKVKAWGCGSTSVGSGFLVDKRLIITNAHIIAGAERIVIETTDGTTLTAEPVWFDSQLDGAMLRTQIAMDATPLAVQPKSMAAGSLGAVLGYPEGSFKVDDATVMQLLNATGYDIYGQTKTTRSVYAIRSTVRPGNSGGPLINSKGEVIGLIFGDSTTQARTGYAVAASQFAATISRVSNTSPAVTTEKCTSGI